MNKEKVIDEIIELIKKAFDSNEYKYITEAFIKACDYNQAHYEESEIFMSEDEDYVMVEDDIYYFDGRF